MLRTPDLALLPSLLMACTVLIGCRSGFIRSRLDFGMTSVTNTSKHPPDENDEPKAPHQPGTKEPEPDFPDPDEESPILITPVQVHSELRPSL